MNEVEMKNDSPSVNSLIIKEEPDDEQYYESIDVVEHDVKDEPDNLYSCVGMDMQNLKESNKSMCNICRVPFRNEHQEICSHVLPIEHDPSNNSIPTTNFEKHEQGLSVITFETLPIDHIPDKPLGCNVAKEVYQIAHLLKKHQGIQNSKTNAEEFDEQIHDDVNTLETLSLHQIPKKCLEPKIFKKVNKNTRLLKKLRNIEQLEILPIEHISEKHIEKTIPKKVYVTKKSLAHRLHNKQLSIEDLPEIPLDYSVCKKVYKNASLWKKYQTLQLMKKYQNDQHLETLPIEHTPNESEQVNLHNVENRFPKSDTDAVESVDSKPFETPPTEHVPDTLLQPIVEKKKAKRTRRSKYHNTHSFKCEICSKEFSHPRNLRRHKLFVHTDIKPNKCTLCGQKFKQWYTLKKHERENHPEYCQQNSDQNTIVNCDMCDKSFKTKNSLKRHQMCHVGDKPYECDICQKQFYRADNLKMHKSIHGEKTFECDVCLRKFVRSTHLQNHKKKVHVIAKPYVCNICNEAFAVVTEYDIHKKTHKKTQFKCDICLKYYKRMVNLKIHQRIHSGDKPFKCEYCDKCFSQNSILKIHRRVHTGEKPFECDLCDAKFNYSSNLTRHILKHNEDRRYECTECGKRFYQLNHLNSHKLIHDKSSVKCEVCKRRFDSVEKLETHQRSHSLEHLYKCDQCEKSFQLPHVLKNHQRVHSEERPYQCKICKTLFKDSTNLKRHIRRHKKAEFCE